MTLGFVICFGKIMPGVSYNFHKRHNESFSFVTGLDHPSLDRNIVQEDRIEQNEEISWPDLVE